MLWTLWVMRSICEVNLLTEAPTFVRVMVWKTPRMSLWLDSRDKENASKFQK